MKKKKQGNDKVFNIVNGLIMVIVCIFIAYPLWYVLVASFTDPAVVNSGKLLILPEKTFLGGYRKILEYKPIWTGYLNTIKYTVVGTVVSIAITVPCAYALSRKDLAGRKILSILFTFTMFFNGGIIPLYLVINKIGSEQNRCAMACQGCGAVFYFF